MSDCQGESKANICLDRALALATRKKGHVVWGKERWCFFYSDLKGRVHAQESKGKLKQPLAQGFVFFLNPQLALNYCFHSVSPCSPLEAAAKKVALHPTVSLPRNGGNSGCFSYQDAVRAAGFFAAMHELFRALQTASVLLRSCSPTTVDTGYYIRGEQANSAFHA